MKSRRASRKSVIGIPRLRFMVVLAVALVAASVPAALAVVHGGGSRGGAARTTADPFRPRRPSPSPSHSPSPSPASPSPSASASPSPTATGAPAAVEGFDEAGVSTGLGDDFTQAQWQTIAADGFKLFITDPIEWSSECSNGSCTSPVDTCTVDSAAVAQIQDAYDVGIDYAVYTRNVNCLTAAIQGLSATLQDHLSFAVLDIEPGPSVPLTSSLVNGVTALGQTPVVYSYQSGWDSVMGDSSAFSSLPLQDGIVPNWGAQFPAAYPAGFPSVSSMPYPFGGWSGYDAQIEQQLCCTDIQGSAGAIDNSSDQVDLDSVSAAWLASLPHQA
jgi:hypothetical protein